jgi:Brp/Blh family beta-carotene 15,15'-monooxygenase
VNDVATASEAQTAETTETVETAVRPLWVALGVTALPFVVGLDPPVWLQYAPLVLSGVVFGMPHGAVDHLIPARLCGHATATSVLAVTGLYVVLGGGYLVTWFLAPAAAAVSFVLLTWCHWGQGDVYLLSAVTGGRYPRSLPHRVLTLLVRGGMPMAVPLVASPDQYRRVIADLVGLFGRDPAAIAVAFRSETRLAVAAVVGGMAVATLARGAVARTADGWTVRSDAGLRIDLVETCLLGGYFLVVEPILAVGLYFCLWHSVRHVVRVLAVDDVGGTALRERRVGAALSRFGRDAAPTTVQALALVVGVYPLVPVAPGVLGEGVALYLVVIAALTLPHVVVVTWMDHRQGLWRARP